MSYHTLMDIVESSVNELTYSEILRKQRTMPKLFPSFHDRVKGVGKKGGVRLLKTTPLEWHFKIHSGTDDSKWYDSMMQFPDLKKFVFNAAKNKTLWNKDKTNVDLNKLANAVMYDADIKLFCDDDSFQFWGPAYLLTKMGANAGPDENRPPKIRNPRQYGAICKHLQLLMDVFPAYASTFAKFLRENYIKTINQAVRQAKAEGEGFQKGAEFLKQQITTGKKVQKPEETEPESKPERTKSKAPKAATKEKPEVEAPTLEEPTTEEPSGEVPTKPETPLAKFKNKAPKPGEEV